MYIFITILILIAAILMILIVPLPPWLLDLALSISITLSVLVLMTGLFIHHPLEFSAFPTVLLIATMLRLALNLATNAGIAPNPRRGSNVVSAADAFTTRGATGPVYRIVEHDVRTVKRRSLATPDAGDVMTFTLTASNQVNALANAYDVRVTDEDGTLIAEFRGFSRALPAGARETAG